MPTFDDALLDEVLLSGPAVKENRQVDPTAVYLSRTVHTFDDALLDEVLLGGPAVKENRQVDQTDVYLSRTVHTLSLIHI